MPFVCLFKGLFLIYFSIFSVCSTPRCIYFCSSDGFIYPPSISSPSPLCFFLEDHSNPPPLPSLLAVCRSVSFHPSFFHLNLSQGDLGWAHLLSSLFSLSPPPLPPQISEASFPCLNPPIPCIRLYPSLQLLVSPSHLSFFIVTLGCRLPYFLSIFLIIATHVFFPHF